MRPETYQHRAEVEARHWWFVGRRGIVDRLIAALGLPADATILDVLEHLDDGLGVPPAPLNRTLTAIFASERHLIGRLPLPVGASLPRRARRPAP